METIVAYGLTACKKISAVGAYFACFIVIVVVIVDVECPMFDVRCGGGNGGGCGYSVSEK